MVVDSAAGRLLIRAGNADEGRRRQRPRRRQSWALITPSKPPALVVTARRNVVAAEQRQRDGQRAWWTAEVPRGPNVSRRSWSCRGRCAKPQRAR
eukprot:5968007-Pleurochrysis_carterae.AAC.1